MQLSHKLAEQEMTSVLAEGGAGLHASLLDADLIDELLLYVAPIAFGGAAKMAAPSWLGGAGVCAIDQAPRFVFAGEPRLVGGDLVVKARRTR